MPTATDEVETTPKPLAPSGARQRLQEVAGAMDEFFQSDDWKTADSPARQQHLDRIIGVFDEEYARAAPDLNPDEADQLFNSGVSFLKGRLAESGDAPPLDAFPSEGAMKAADALRQTRNDANAPEPNAEDYGRYGLEAIQLKRSSAQERYPKERLDFIKKTGLRPEHVDRLMDDREALERLKDNAVVMKTTGEVAVPPQKAMDEAEWNSAVDATNATPEKKAKAKAHRLKVRDQLAGKIEFSLAAVDPEWEKWSAAMAGEMKDASVGEKVERFIKWRKASGAKMSAIDRAVDQNAASFVKQFFGLIGGITNIGMMKEAAATAGEIERANETIRSAIGGAGATGFAVDLFGGLAPTIAFSPLARLATTNLGAMRLMAGIGAAQGYGGKYADASAAYSEQGLSDQEAHMKAQLPALVSALTTYALARMMPRGVESIGQINSAKAAAKTAYRKWAGELLADVGDEALEEAFQAVSDEITAKFTYDPKKDMRTALENIFMSGLMGGIGGGVVGAVSRYANKVKPILETAEQMRKDGYPLAAAETEKTAEIEATKQYWADVAKAQKRAVEHTQANEGPQTERAAYGRTGDVYDAFGNVQRKSGSFLGLPDAGNPEGAPKAVGDANYKPEPAKESEPKNEKAQSVPSVQKADEPVRLPQKEVAPAAPSPEPVTPVAAKPVEQPTPAPKDTTERIQEAAYRDASGKIYKTGAFHDSSKLPKKFQADNENARGVEPGWLTSSGRFVGREEGFAIAAASKQVKDSYKAEWPNVLGHFNVKPETLGKQPTTAQIEQAIADANWLGTVREVPAPRSMGGEGVKLYIPVDASGKDVSVGGQTILGKTPAEAIELAQKNTKPAPAPPAAAPSPATPQSEGGIFGYSWADIRSKQQGGTLAALIRGNAPKATESDFAVLEKHGMDWLYDNKKVGIIDRLGLPVERPSKKAVEAKATEGQFSIYQMERKDGMKWMVQSGEKRGFGDGIFDTKAEAEKYAATEKTRQQERAAAVEREAQKNRDEEAAKELRERDVNDFTAAIGATPLAAGKLKKTLMEQVAKRTAGKVYEGTRAQVAKQLLAAGFKPTSEQVDAVKDLTGAQMNRMDNKEQAAHEKRKREAGKKTEYRLENSEGNLFEVTKAEHDYAKWLEAAQVNAAPAPVTEAAALRAKIVKGATVEVSLVRGSKLTHRAKVQDVDTQNGVVTVTFKKGKKFNGGETQTVRLDQVAPLASVQTRMLNEVQFEGMTEDQKRQTKADAKEFDRLVRDHPEMGWYNWRVDDLAGTKSGDMDIAAERKRASMEAMEALGGDPTWIHKDNSVMKAELLPKLKAAIEEKAHELAREAPDSALSDDTDLLPQGEAPATPKLRPSDGKGTGELLQGDAAPFNLVAETAADIAKREEREAAEQVAKEAKDAAEAKAKQDKEQGNLFDEDPFTIADSAPTTSLPVASVQRAVRVVAERLAGAMPHEVIADGSQYPQRVKDAFRKKYGASGDLNRIRGVVVGGKIYINAAAIENAREAIETFMHEAAGHGGVDALLKAFGGKATTQLDAMLKRLFPDDYAAVQRSYEPHEQVSETLARIMQRVGPEMSAQHRTRWQRVVDWLRNALNKLGVKQWSTNDVMALLRRGVDAVRKQRAVTPDAGAVRMSYAGEKAQVPQFMRDSLDTAKAMAAAGKTSEEIRAVTGWFPGKYDGKMRWEVPDDGVRFTEEADKTTGRPMPLQNAIAAPDLFSAYPRLKSVGFQKLTLPPNAGGYFDPISNEIVINRARPQSEQISSLLHEVQHWIQKTENFAEGSDPSNHLYDTDFVLSEVASAKMAEVEREIQKLNAEDRQIGEFFRNIPDSEKGVGRHVDKSRRLDAISHERRALIERRSAITKPERDAFALSKYRRSAGELEARDVQARQNFTPEQRKAVEPYSSENIAKEDAIVMHGGGPQMSIGKPQYEIEQGLSIVSDEDTGNLRFRSGAESMGARQGNVPDRTGGGSESPEGEQAGSRRAKPDYRKDRQTWRARPIGVDSFATASDYIQWVQGGRLIDRAGNPIRPDTSDIRFSLKDENPKATSTTKRAVMDKEREVAMLQGSADKLLQDIRKSGRPPTVEEMQQIAAIDSLIAKRQAEIQAEASNVAQGATPPEINIADLNAEPPDREETGESGPRTYGGKFDSMDAQRAERGLPPLARRFRKANRVLWDAAVKRFETEPKWADRLVDEISSGEKTVLTDEEFAGVFAQQIDLHNKRQEAADRARDPNLSEEEQRDALDQFQYYEKKLQASEILKGMAGSEAGAALQSLKLMANEDFSLAAMEARERKAKQSGLTPEEVDRIRDEATRIAKAQADLDARKAATEAAERIANAEAKIAEWSKIPSRVLEYAKQKVNEWVSAGNAASERLRARAGQVNVGVDPMILGDIFLFARGKIAQGMESFGNFAASTASEFGEWVRPYLKPAWDKAMKYLNTNQPGRKVSDKQKARQQAATEDAASIEDGIRAMAEEGLPDDMGRYVKRLANAYVKSGATTVKGVMARLHAFLDPVMGNPTDDVLLDLWTDYGGGKAATEDALKRLQSQIRQEALIVRQIIDAEAALVRSQAGEDVGDYLKLTGQQRVPVRDQARALAQQLNELKKKIPPPQSTAESRRQSALDALEKRTRNRIKDLRFEIAKGERTIKNRGVTPTSPNLEALRAELATVEAEHLAVFGRREATPEQKLKSAIKSAERAEQKALAELEAAKRGVFTRPVQKGAETRNEVLVIRARADAARAETQALKELANPPLSDAQKRLDAALVARERWEQMLAGEQKPTSRQPQESLTQLEEDARMEIAAMRELAAQIRRDAKPATDPDDAKVRALEAAAAEYERRVNESDFTAKSKTTTADSARVAQARALRDAALAAYNAAKNAAGVTEQTKIANRKAAMLRQIADLTDRLAKSDFEKRPPRPPVDLSKDSEAVRIASDLQEIKSNYAKRLLHYIKERRGGYEKFTDAMWTAITAERSLMGSGDLSATRQGIRMAYSHPIMAAKAMWRSIRTIFSQKQAVSYEAERKLRPNYALYKPMKIQMPSVEAEAHDRMSEEGVRSNIEDWADIKLSGNPLLVLPKLVPKLLGHYVRASSRTFTTFLNELAADVADYRINELRDKPMSKIEKEALGDMINSARGRGLKAGAGKLAQFVFYSANFLAARAKNLSGYHVWRRNSSARIRKIALKEQFRAIAGWMVVSAISRYFYGDTGDDEDMLDKAKRLFKLRVTDSDARMEYDYTGGEAKLVRLGAALIEGISTTIQAMLSGQEEADKQRAFTSYATIGREIRSISAPWMGVAADLYTGSNYDGKVPTVPSIARDLTVPLAWRSADEFFERAGFAKTVGAKLQEAIGVGVSVTRDKTAPKERRYSR